MISDLKNCEVSSHSEVKTINDVRMTQRYAPKTESRTYKHRKKGHHAGFHYA